VAASAFQEYASAAAGNFDASDLRFLLLDTDQHRRVGVAAVDDRFLVLAVAEPERTVKELQSVLAAATKKLAPSLGRVGTAQAARDLLDGAQARAAAAAAAGAKELGGSQAGTALLEGGYGGGGAALAGAGAANAR
jgi:hypothetical protein